jgi:aquaporin Z
MSNASRSKKYLAEFIGTFVLIFMGCGSAVLAGKYIGFVGIAFAFGLSVLVMVYAIGGISGCHINPAISISMLASGKIGAKDAAIYVVMQCLGAVIAAAVLYAVALGKPGYSLAVNGLGQNGYGVASPGGFSMLSGFIAEVVLTFIFLLVIYGSTSEAVPKGFAGIPIGLSLVLIHLVGIPITGTSVNPARSLGPAVLVGGVALSELWLFWVVPIIGGLLAAVLWRFLGSE